VGCVGNCELISKAGWIMGYPGEGQGLLLQLGLDYCKTNSRGVQYPRVLRPPDAYNYV